MQRNKPPPKKFTSLPALYSPGVTPGVILSRRHVVLWMLTLRLHPKEHHRIASGHLWVYRDELQDLPEAPPGTLVQVESADGAPLGSGFYNPLSKITVRMLGETVEEADTDFFVRRFRQAVEFRQRFLPNEDAYRVVFGEADLLSGLIVDRYDTVAVVQMLSAGMDVRMPQILEALRIVMPDITGIVERNSAQTRKKEGLEFRDGPVWGNVPSRVAFTENGIRLEVDLVGGQKTGYFLDQKLNRRVVASLSKDRTVLDCFCNVGGFALNAARGGASLAVGVDSSQMAIDHARHHAEINGFDNCTFEQANVFDLLREHVEQVRTWDIVVLDPPSFAKSRSAIRGAHAGYAELNRTAMKLLTKNGLLVTASCTQLVPEHDLMDIIYREAARLRKRLRLVHRGNQSPDHPVLLAMPETQYLKFLIFQEC